MHIAARLALSALLPLSLLASAGAAAAEQGAAPTGATDPLDELEEATPTVIDSGYGEAVDRAAVAWVKAWRAKPRLVSLRESSGFDDLAKRLRGRLKVLGNKTFSNREWRTYWKKQQATGTALAEALRGIRDPPAVAARTALRAWAGMAADKQDNQDRYLDAIETERDAVEERLEAAMEPEAETKAERPGAAAVPTPYQRRKLHLAELRHRADWQKRKRRLAEMDRKLIERQLKSEEILLRALVRDVRLARRERDIASGQARRSAEHPVFGSTWRTIAADAESKVTKLVQEALHGAARGRARRVELNLASSRIRFRDQRIRALSEQIDRDGGFNTWLHASWLTLLDWLTTSAWRIAIALVLIWLGLRVAMWLVGRAVRAIVIRAEGDPDDTSDDDTRILTLANVFSGVARLAMWAIAALLALEAIGVNTGPLLGSVAILGLAVSFGSQNLVRDVVNGFFILMENQYAVGEVVDLGGKSGTVEKITIRSTWIRQLNGAIHVVPNGSISAVSNLTRDWNRGVVHIGVGYGADLDRVREVIDRVGAELYAEPEWEELLQEAPSYIGVTELGDSAVVVRVMAKCDAGAQWGLERELNLRLKKALDAAGIEIPFPQRVIWQGQG